MAVAEFSEFRSGYLVAGQLLVQGAGQGLVHAALCAGAPGRDRDYGVSTVCGNHSIVDSRLTSFRVYLESGAARWNERTAEALMAGYPASLRIFDGFSVYPHGWGVVARMTREMFLRFGVEGVRINVVAPGFVCSLLVENVVDDPDVNAESQRLDPKGQPEEIAAVVAFLASDDASFVTANVWPVDKGYTAQ